VQKKTAELKERKESVFSLRPARIGGCSTSYLENILGMLGLTISSKIHFRSVLRLPGLLFLFFIFKLRSLGRPAIDLIFAQTPVLSTSVLF